MRERLTQAIADAAAGLLRAAGDADAPPEFTLEVPRQAEHGDFATNAALLLAKPGETVVRGLAGGAPESAP